MQIPFDVYAITLTEENVVRIEEAAKPLGWTLDHIQDSMECNADYGWSTILFMKLFKDSTEIATFNDVADTASKPEYRLTDELDPLFGIFHKIEKI